MYFYDILKDIMEQKDLKIADVARMCGLPDSTVRSIINRKQKTVALDVAFKLSDGLDVPLSFLNGNVQSSFSQKKVEPVNYELSDEEMVYLNHKKSLIDYIKQAKLTTTQLKELEGIVKVFETVYTENI